MTARERREAYPTMAIYLKGQSDEGLARLIYDSWHRTDVFATYPGTSGDLAAAIIREAMRRGAETASALKETAR